MIAIDIKKLVSVIGAAAAFEVPGMSGGTEYMYNNIYRRLADGKNIKLSEIDFSAFAPEDIDELTELHRDVFECNSYNAVGIARKLNQAAPVCEAVGYI